LVGERNVDPQRVVALTFTRAAAYELPSRIGEELAGKVAERPTATTLHSYALRNLLRNGGRFRLITQPTTSDHYTVTPAQMRLLGAHVAKLYRVNKEYADLCANRMQDSRDLNEPPSNVVGALGVFTAFNLQNVYFNVVKKN
jgi:superfamily I DNA/RNA helicase